MLLNTMKSFLDFKVISNWISVYFQKGFTMNFCKTPPLFHLVLYEICS